MEPPAPSEHRPAPEPRGQPFRLHWLPVLCLMLAAFGWGYGLRGKHEREARARAAEMNVHER